MRVEHNSGTVLKLESERKRINVVGDDEIEVVVELAPQEAVVMKEAIGDSIGSDEQGCGQQRLSDYGQPRLPDADESDPRSFLGVEAHNRHSETLSKPVDLALDAGIMLQVAEDEDKGGFHGIKTTRYFYPERF